MRASCIKLFICMLAFCISWPQAPLDLMQLFAWGGMIVEYGSDDGLAPGVKKTFSGDAPCPFCVSIDAQRDSQGAGAAFTQQNRSSLVACWFSTHMHLAPDVRRADREIEPFTFAALLPERPEVPPPIVG